MISTIRRRLIGCYATALFAFVACNVIAPKEAEAGCGTHTATAWGFSATSPDLSALSLADSSHRLGTPGERRPPCTGLSCSQLPRFPLVPTSTGSGRLEQWGCLGPSIPEDVPGLFETFRHEVKVQPLYVSSPLDPPPRIPASPVSMSTR
jgi:hypothetical protein